MLQLEGIVGKYGDFTAVKDVNLSIEKGEFFTLLGPSGCGKTTTLRMVAGFEKPAAGRVVIAGNDVTSIPPEERQIGFVFQNYALFPNMNVRENIAFGLKIQKVNKADIAKRVEAIAEQTGLQEYLNKKVSELSGGQQQRVAIARAMVLNPRLLLMDEPLSNLDAKLRVSMREEIKNLQKQFGITTVYVTHDQEEALEISDRIAVFNKGVIEQVGTPKEIYGKPRTQFVAEFIGNINRLDGSCLQGTGNYDSGLEYYIRPEHISFERHSAEDIAVPVKVVRCTYLGASSRVTVEYGGHKLDILDYTDREKLSIGDEIDVYLDCRYLIKFTK